MFPPTDYVKIALIMTNPVWISHFCRTTEYHRKTDDSRATYVNVR
jgi:hypothetical protein